MAGEQEKRSEMKIIVSIAYPLCALLIVSWVIETYGTVAGLCLGCLCAANYYYLMRKF